MSGLHLKLTLFYIRSEVVGMNTLEPLNNVMQYIENNLEHEVDDKEIAKLAFCSAYHFKRTFSFLAGISLQEYIRRRRLTRAAIELQDSTIKVIDIAIKYGYNSSDAFTRAFQKLHGMTPSETRDYKRPIKTYPPMTFQINVGGSEPMKIKIESMESFQIVGIKSKVTGVDVGEHPGINDLWKSTDNETYTNLKSFNNMDPYGILHVDVEEEKSENRNFDYYLAVATTMPCPNHFTKFIVPSMTWAKIEVKVPWSKEKWNYIYGEWFPSTGYEQIEGLKIQIGPEIQVGIEKQIMTKEIDAELWLPIAKIK